MCEPGWGGGPSDRELQVGDAPRGSVFEATATHAGQTASARTVPYRGAVSAVRPPGLLGRPRVGALVRPEPASWTGGWGREVSFLQTQVCRRSRTGCVVIADDFYWDPCPGAGAVLDERYRGWYLWVVDRRIDRHTAFASFAAGYPEALDPIEPGPAAAAKGFGRIARATGPARSTCGRPDPRYTTNVRLLRTAKVTRRRAVLGSIRCRRACRVTLTARHGSRTIKTTRRFTDGKRHLLLHSRRGIARLRGRRVRVSVDVGGRRLATRSVSIPHQR